LPVRGYTFGRPKRAEAELRAVLPAQVVSAVDWSSLRLEPGSVVDPELRETESDLLFTARLRTGRPLLLYVLPETAETVSKDSKRERDSAWTVEPTPFKCFRGLASWRARCIRPDETQAGGGGWAGR
jgi:hypothetical protein